jgi:AraC-like DNA-binding protein
VPSRHTGLAISLGDPIHLVRAPGSPVPTERQAFIVGPSIGPATVAYGNRRDGLFVHLKFNAIFALFGIRPYELSSQTVDLSLLYGNAFEDLMNRLVDVSAWPERFAILDQIFLNALKPVHTPPELTWAWNELLASRGCVTVHQIAAGIGWSRQHLIKRFRHEFGMPPKTASRIVRFERAVQVIKSGRMGLADVAAECGYYDQAHLTHEWHAMTGCSPKTWILRELPFFQYPELSQLDD